MVELEVMLLWFPAPAVFCVGWFPQPCRHRKAGPVLSAWPAGAQDFHPLQFVPLSGRAGPAAGRAPDTNQTDAALRPPRSHHVLTAGGTGFLRPPQSLSTWEGERSRHPPFLFSFFQTQDYDTWLQEFKEKTVAVLKQQMITAEPSVSDGEVEAEGVLEGHVSSSHLSLLHFPLLLGFSY